MYKDISLKLGQCIFCVWAELLPLGMCWSVLLLARLQIEDDNGKCLRNVSTTDWV